MSSIKLAPNASGTGEFTIAAPNSNTNRTFNLPDSSGTIATAESTLSQFNASGSAPVYAARAWVNFNGTGTVAIRASGNVSSITDNGVGDYTVNFTNAMPDANYSISTANSIEYAVSYSFAGSINTSSSGNVESAPTTSNFRSVFYRNDGNRFDPKYVNLAIFR